MGNLEIKKSIRPPAGGSEGFLVLIAKMCYTSSIFLKHVRFYARTNI